MGTLKNGPFGDLHGRVGNLVSYRLKNKNVVRLIGRSTKPPTRAMLANYQRMAVVNHFLQPMLDFLNLGFAMAVQGTMKNPYNEAVSYNKMFALQGEYPFVELDYSRAMLAQGPLPVADQPAASRTTGGLEVTWSVRHDWSWSRKNDRVMLMLYFPEVDPDTSELEKVIYVLSGERRSSGAQFVELLPDQMNQEIAAYLAFVADNKLLVSNSVYIKPV